MFYLHIVKIIQKFLKIFVTFVIFNVGLMTGMSRILLQICTALNY